MVLLSRVYKEEKLIGNVDLIKNKILSTLEYGNNKLKNRIKEKAFNRRLKGELLSFEKIEKAKTANNKESELMYSLSNLMELVFIKEMNNEEKYSNKELENIINNMIKEIKSII